MKKWMVSFLFTVLLGTFTSLSPIKGGREMQYELDAYEYHVQCRRAGMALLMALAAGTTSTFYQCPPVSCLGKVCAGTLCGLLALTPFIYNILDPIPTPKHWQ